MDSSVRRMVRNKWRSDPPSPLFAGRWFARLRTQSGDRSDTEVPSSACIAADQYQAEDQNLSRKGVLASQTLAVESVPNLTVEMTSSSQ